MKRGKAVVTLFPVRHVCFCEKVMFREQIIPAICCTKINWFESGRHEAGGKLSQFSVSHRVHCSCNLSPLQLKPVSSWCAGACVLFLHRALYVYNTHEEASPRRNISASAC